MNSNPSVLIVDNEPLVLKATARLLESKGWQVDTITSTPWTEDCETVDIVLADWQPNGLGTVKSCNEAGVPVVVFTGGDIYEVWRAVPGVEVLRKPVSGDELDSALRGVLGGGAL